MEHIFKSLLLLLIYGRNQNKTFKTRPIILNEE